MVGLFVVKGIKAGEELTFNYNFGSNGSEKKIATAMLRLHRANVSSPLEDPSLVDASRAKRPKDRKFSDATDERQKSAIQKALKNETPGGGKARKRKTAVQATSYNECGLRKRD